MNQRARGWLEGLLGKEDAARLIEEILRLSTSSGRTLNPGAAMRQALANLGIAFDLDSFVEWEKRMGSESIAPSAGAELGDEHETRFRAYVERAKRICEPHLTSGGMLDPGNRFEVERRGVRLALTLVGQRTDYSLRDSVGPIEQGEIGSQHELDAVLKRWVSRGDQQTNA